MRLSPGGCSRMRRGATRSQSAASSLPFYQGEASWLTDTPGARRDIFVMAFRLAVRSMAVQDIDRQLEVLQRPDTLLVDTQTLPIYGPKTPGRMVELQQRAVKM